MGELYDKKRFAERVSAFPYSYFNFEWEGSLPPDNSGEIPISTEKHSANIKSINDMVCLRRSKYLNADYTRLGKPKANCYAFACGKSPRPGPDDSQVALPGAAKFAKIRQKLRIALRDKNPEDPTEANIVSEIKKEFVSNQSLFSIFQTLRATPAYALYIDNVLKELEDYKDVSNLIGNETDAKDGVFEDWRSGKYSEHLQTFLKWDGLVDVNASANISENKSYILIAAFSQSPDDFHFIRLNKNEWWESLLGEGIKRNKLTESQGPASIPAKGTELVFFGKNNIAGFKFEGYWLVARDDCTLYSGKGLVHDDEGFRFPTPSPAVTTLDQKFFDDHIMPKE